MRQRPRGRLAVAAATVTGDNGDLAMSGEPRLDSAALAIRQEGYDAPTLQVADQRAVALSSPESPIVDADHAWTFRRPCSAAAHGPQQRVPAGRNHEPAGEAGGRPAAERETEVVHDAIESTGAPRAGGSEVRLEPFAEDPGPAVRPDAAEPTDANLDDDAPAGDRQVRQRARVVVVETIGDRPAIDLAHRVLKALWEEEANTGDQDTLKRLIGEVGLDGPSVLERADDGRFA